MSKVRVVTDSSAWLPPEVLEKFDIQIIPHRIRVGKKVFLESDEFSSTDLFEQLDHSDPTNTKNLPSIGNIELNDMLDYYQSVGQETDSIVSIHMSRELSPMCADARRAAEVLKGRQTIRVIDSMSTSFGLGMLVAKAAQIADQGADVHEIARIINGAVPHLYFTGFAESLNYLERSEQIGASQNLLGTLLGIKAMLILEEGELQPLEKVQTQEEVVEKLFDFVIEFAVVEEVGILEHEYSGAAEALTQRIAEDARLADVTVHQITYPPSLATYMGPNMLGVLVYEGEY